MLLLLLIAGGAGAADLRELKSLDPSTDAVKAIRNDVRKSIYVIKSRRPDRELPDLKFYVYRVKKGDTFWNILAKSSLDIDTLISVNGFSTPRDISPGKKIFIPNMRGVILPGSRRNTIDRILRENSVLPEYVDRANRTRDFGKDHLFIPCGTVSKLERSLFLGSGFMYPLPSPRGVRLTSGFGARRNPFNRRDFEFHSGIDIACPIASDVLAARDGKVVFAGFEGGYGRLVVVEHEFGYRSYYGHLSRALVKPGDRVKRGGVIALSGNTGRTTGPHLHFEVRKGGMPVHPGSLVHEENK